MQERFLPKKKRKASKRCVKFVSSSSSLFAVVVMSVFGGDPPAVAAVATVAAVAAVAAVDVFAVTIVIDVYCRILSQNKTNRYFLLRYFSNFLL